jgi:hypothetical protein
MQQQLVQPQAPVQQIQPNQTIPSNPTYYYPTPEQEQPFEQSEEISAESVEEPKPMQDQFISEQSEILEE